MNLTKPRRLIFPGKALLFFQILGKLVYKNTYLNMIFSYVDNYVVLSKFLLCQLICKYSYSSETALPSVLLWNAMESHRKTLNYYMHHFSVTIYSIHSA